MDNNVKRIKSKAKIIVVADRLYQALDLYEAGADYVVVPRVVSGEHLAHLINSRGIGKEHFAKLKDRHFNRLAKDRFG